MIRTSSCVVCGGAAIPRVSEIRDCYFGMPGTWTVVQCRDCGLEQTHPFPPPEELTQLYERHYNFGGETGSLFARWRDRILRTFLYQAWLRLDGDPSFRTEAGHGRRLLDYGCNEGRGLALYAAHGFQAEGFEINTVAADAARRKGFQVWTGRFDPAAMGSRFDVVILANVLEHAPNPSSMLQEVRQVLKPGGEVWISCPNSRSVFRTLFGKTWIHWHVPFHLFHFDRPRLEHLLQRAGFTVLSCRSIAPAFSAAQSCLSRWFGLPGQPSKVLRSMAALIPLTLAIRLLGFPFLFLAGRRGRGDFLILKARWGALPPTPGGV